MSAAATDKLQKVGLSTATTLSAPGYTSGGTSVTIGSTTNWPSDTGVTFAIDTVTIENGVEVQDAGSYNEYVGTVASGTSVTNVSWADGNGDRNYSAGSTTRVYIPVSKTRENRIVTWGTTEHNQNGTHAAVTATSVSTSAGVTAGSGLTMSAGAFSLTGTFTGWVGVTGSWTYASASSPEYTITVPTDATTIYQIGDKIQLTQSATVKYFIVTKVAATLLTVYGGTDYTLANAAISAISYSRARTPFGFPADPLKWTVRYTYTDDNSTTSATYAQVGAHQISLPTGSWDVAMKFSANIALGGANACTGHVSLSTATNSVTDAELSSTFKNPSVASIASNQDVPGYVRKTITVTSATVYYQIFARDNALTFSVLGASDTGFIEARCALL